MLFYFFFVILHCQCKKTAKMDLSVIFPVFNVEKYIQVCMESIFRQGLDDDSFEVIIVNDGTQDNSMEVIDDIIDQHKNISVINQDNQGLSVARNNGIAIAKGEYILMPDSDDLLVDNSLRSLLEKALETKADLVISDFITLNDEVINDLNKETLRQPPFQCIKGTGQSLFLDFLNPHECYVWRTLYRREFLTKHKISFISGIKYQDIPFTHECYLKANSFIKTNIILNIYRRRSGSSTQNYTSDNSRDFIIAMTKTWELRQIKGLSPDIIYKLEEDVYISFRSMLYSTLHCIKQKAERNKIMDYLNANAAKLKFTHGIRQRLITILFKRTPHLFINLYYQFAQIAYK